MSRIFDALRKADAERPAMDVSHPVGPAPAAAQEQRPRALAPPIPRRDPDRMARENGSAPALIPIREVAELPEDVVREMTRLRVATESLLPGRASRSVMFASAQGGEGTSTVAYQFAFTLARDTGIRVLIVDAHARRPSLVSDPGSVAATPIRSGAARGIDPRVLDGWPLGEQFHAVGVLSPTLMREAIEWGSERYDWIVLDGPPVLESADGAPIAAMADGVIVVVEAGRTKRPVLQRAVDLLRKAGGQVLGSVLNRRRLEIPEFIYRRI